MQKNTFKQIFIVVAILLCILPVLVTFSSILTNFFNKMGWYVWLQNLVVPIESRMVAVIIRLVAIKAIVTPGSSLSMILHKPDGAIIPIVLHWNCLGWQSMLLLAASFATGLRGNYSLLSKLETILFGILGTFLSNLFRMAFIVSLAYYWNSLSAMIVHDYFAMFVAMIWMIFYWYFSYSFILESKNNNSVQV